MLKCVAPSVLIKNTWAAVCNLMKRHDAKRTLNSWGIQLKCAVDDGKEITKLSRPPKIDRLRKYPMTDPLREDVTAIPCRELLSSISFRIPCHPRKTTRKIEKGKKQSDTQTEEDPSNLWHKQSSRVRAVSPFWSSLLRESKKVKKKKKKINKEK